MPTMIQVLCWVPQTAPSPCAHGASCLGEYIDNKMQFKCSGKRAFFSVFWVERMVPRSLRVFSSFIKKKEFSLGSWSDGLSGNDSLVSILDLAYKIKWPPPKSPESLGLLIRQMNILCILLVTRVGVVLCFLVAFYFGGLLPQLYHTLQFLAG